MARDRLGRSKIFPEFAFFESEEERKQMRKRFNRRLFRDWRLWAYVIGGPLAFSVFVISLDLPGAVGRLLPWLPYLGRSAVVGGVFGGFSAVGYNFLWRKPLRRFLREQLVAKGVPICLHCGYDLRGQTEPRCPECGKAFDPALLKDKADLHRGEGG